jgi:hypothetical protein
MYHETANTLVSGHVGVEIVGVTSRSQCSKNVMLSFRVQTNCWRKVRAQKGVAVPRGRRGHTALVHQGTMLVYGGYQDLRGSSNELWGFHFGK